MNPAPKKKKIWSTPMLLLSSLVALSPIAAGLLLWNQLPDPMPSHWNLHGEVDGYQSLSFVVFFMPLLMLAIHWLCIGMAMIDPKTKQQEPFTLTLLLWLVPVMSVFFNGAILAHGIDPELPIPRLLCSFIALLAIGMGYYMPRLQPNGTMGIRISWTMNNPATWQATHQMAGRLWIGLGLVQLLCALVLPVQIAFPVVFVLYVPMIVLPLLFARKHALAQQDR